MEYEWKIFLDKLHEEHRFSHLFEMMEEHGEQTESEIRDQSGCVVKRSFSDCVAEAKRVCGSLQSRFCFPKGSFVGFVYRTSPNWAPLFWGILMSGYTPILLNPESPDARNAELLRESGAVLYVSDKPISGCDAVFAEASGILSEKIEGTPAWGDSVALCTSGTADESRIFLYSGEAIVNQLISFDDAHRVNDDIPFSDRHPCRVLAFLPFHHVFGFISVYILYACAGKTLVFLREKSLKEIYSVCREQKVTHLFSVPMLFNALASEIGPKHSKPLGDDIRYMISGGGFLPETTLRKINEAGYPLYNGYGMTECGILTVETARSAKKRIRGSVGKPFSITQYCTEPENPGELLIRGDGLYSASVVNGKIIPRDPNAWFRTGDVVSVTADGLFFSGRSKDVIINSTGENIYPDELETAFVGLPFVKRFCILGLKKDAYEEICLVAEVNEETDGSSIVRRVLESNSKRGFGEQITRVLLVTDPLPVSDSGKVRRLKLKEAIEVGSVSYNECKLSEKDAKRIEENGKNEMETNEEKKEIKEKIRVIISDALKLPVESIKDEDNFVYDLHGESLTLIGAVSSMEDCFNVVISDDEIHQMSNVNRSAEIIFAKLHGEKAIAREEGTKPTEGCRITDFKESEQYKALRKRMDETFLNGRSPYLIPHESLIRDTSIVYGKKVINLGSNNYLGMSGNPEVTEAAVNATRIYGTSASGSRTLSSEKTLYRELEKMLAEWKHTDDSIVCSGGWAENLSFMSCFMQEGDLILYDSLSHNSIMQGIALSKAESKAFTHNDRKMLEEILKRVEGKYNKVLIFVEGVYSMDGDIAPIPDFVRLKKQYHCFLMVDEAHALGVIGKTGRGVDEYYDLEPNDIDIKFGTLSKALGCCGGYIAAEKSIVEYLRYNMGAYVYSTGIAPPLAAGSMKALEILRGENSPVKKLQENIAYFVRRCKEEGMNTCLAKESGIVPILIGADADAAILSQRLLENGIFVPPSMYPAVPKGGSRIRFTLSATHSKEQLETAATTMARLMREMHLIQ